MDVFYLYIIVIVCSLILYFSSIWITYQIGFAKGYSKAIFDSRLKRKSKRKSSKRSNKSTTLTTEPLYEDGPSTVKIVRVRASNGV